jgi:hypothetical protein
MSDAELKETFDSAALYRCGTIICSRSLTDLGGG